MITRKIKHTYYSHVTSYCIFWSNFQLILLKLYENSSIQLKNTSAILSLYVSIFSSGIYALYWHHYVKNGAGSCNSWKKNFAYLLFSQKSILYISNSQHVLWKFLYNRWCKLYTDTTIWIRILIVEMIKKIFSIWELIYWYPSFIYWHSASVNLYKYKLPYFH